MATESRRREFYELSRPLAEMLGMLTQPIDPQPGTVVRVPSRTKAGMGYDVHIGIDGEPVCTCPASFNYLKCWHIKYVKETQMATETAVALRPINLKPTAVALLPSDEDLARADKVAALAMAGAIELPRELNNQKKVASVILYGAELGLAPFTALRHLYIVNGRVAPSAEVMAGMLMKADPDARLIVEKCEVQSNGNTITGGICTMRILRPSRSIDARYSVDWEEIKRAGLASGNNLKYPEDRLRYHCTKRLLRIYAPDIINGFDGPALPADDITVEGAPDFDELYNEGDEPTEGDYREVQANVDHETGEIIDAEPTAPIAPATPEQVAQIEKLVADIKDSWGAASQDFIALQRKLVADYGAEKLKHLASLTGDEAAAIITYLRERNGEPPVT